MAKALVLYYSRTGTTEEMAKIIGEALQKKEIEAVVKSVVDVEVDELRDCDAIIAGSPTYYGLPAAQMKHLFDESVRFHGKLDGKVGAAFSSAANLAGGNETTILAILQMMLVHGMIVKGSAQGDHYGPVAVGGVDKRARKGCENLAAETAELINRLALNG